MHSYNKFRFLSQICRYRYSGSKHLMDYKSPFIHYSNFFTTSTTKSGTIDNVNYQQQQQNVEVKTATPSNNDKVQRKSLLPDINVVDKTIHDFYFDVCNQYSNLTAFIYTLNGEKCTFGQILEQSNRIAYGLYKHGLQKGDVVTVCLPNCPEYVSITLGCLARGGVVSGINPLYTETELTTYLKISTTKFVFVRNESVSKLIEVATKLDHQIREIIVTNGEIDSSTNVPSSIKLTTLEELSSQVSSQNLPVVNWNTKTDLALLPFSSGTTGLPKGIMLSHYNFISQIQILDQAKIYKRTNVGDRVISSGPFYHIYGLIQVFTSLLFGNVTALMPGFDKELYLKTIEKYRVPVLFAVPPIVNLLAKDPSVEKYDLSSVRTCVSGASPLSNDVALEFARRFPNVCLLQGYGLTEVSGTSHIMPEGKSTIDKISSCGILLPNYETKITSLDNNEELGYNQVGELCLKGQTCMLGYFNDKKATDDIYDDDGFLHTGDVCYYDNDGNLYVVDRLKELIKVRGYQVAPTELENILLTHPDIRDAAVIGVKDNLSGEVPKAFVVLGENSKLNGSEIANYVNSKVINYKHVKGGVEVVKQIPKAPTGKVLRRLLMENEKAK